MSSTRTVLRRGKLNARLLTRVVHTEICQSADSAMPLASFFPIGVLRRVIVSLWTMSTQLKSPPGIRMSPNVLDTQGYQTALLTVATTLAIYIGVEEVIGMSTRTCHLRCISSRGANASKKVDLGSNRFYVLGIAAPPIAAQMVELQSKWDRAHQQPISKKVCGGLLTMHRVESTVSFAKSSHPFPTTLLVAIKTHLAPKALCDRLFTALEDTLGHYLLPAYLYCRGSV